MTIKTIFLDRDGVINKEVGYLHKIEDFKFIDGIFDACLFFLKLNYQIIIVTNQSGIARGYFNHSDYQKLTQWMLNQFFTKNPETSILLSGHFVQGRLAPNMKEESGFRQTNLRCLFLQKK